MESYRQHGPNVGDNGTYTATFTPESGVDNYDALTKDGVTLNITKAAYGNQSVSGSAKYGTTGSVDLSRYLPQAAVLEQSPQQIAKKSSAAIPSWRATP